MTTWKNTAYCGTCNVLAAFRDADVVVAGVMPENPTAVEVSATLACGHPKTFVTTTRRAAA